MEGSTARTRASLVPVPKIVHSNDKRSQKTPHKCNKLNLLGATVVGAIEGLVVAGFALGASEGLDVAGFSVGESVSIVGAIDGFDVVGFSVGEG